jgi:hypothetical protein
MTWRGWVLVPVILLAGCGNDTDSEGDVAACRRFRSARADRHAHERGRERRSAESTYRLTVNAAAFEADSELLREAILEYVEADVGQAERALVRVLALCRDLS